MALNTARTGERWIIIAFALLSLSTSSGQAAIFDANGTDVKDLNFVALFPISPARPESKVAWAVRSAIYLALRHINADETILHGFRLQMESYDTKCEMAEGTKAFFEAIDQGPPKLMLFGGICSNVTAPLAEAVMSWKLIQMSYANTEPFLSEREKYPTFFRTVPSEADFNPAKLKLLDHFNWTRVATIHQDTPNFSIAHNKMSSLLETADKELVKVASFAEDPENAVQDVKDSGARIIIGYFEEAIAGKVFCWAHRKDLVGNKYVWILSGGYPENWWNNTEIPDFCRMDDFLKAIQGYLTTDILPLSTSNEDTVSGLTASRYEEEYDRLKGENYTKLHGYAYDGVWAVALALDSVLRQLGSNKSALVEFDYGNEEVFTMIMEAMNETDFIGVTGPVRFKDGDRLGTIMYEQFQDGVIYKIGEYHAYIDATFLDTDTIYWADGLPPLDQRIVNRIPHGVSFILYVIMGCFSYIGIMLAFMFLFFNMRFRKHRFIKMSSPYLNNLIIIGGILCYCYIYLLGLDGPQFTDYTFQLICSLRAWVLTIGFTVAFGAMFSKTWRVHSIFTNIKMKKRVIRDYKLFAIVGVLLLIDVLLLTTWQIKDPQRRREVEGPEQADPLGRDISIVPVMRHCQSLHMTIWLACIYVYKGVLMVFGLFLAWETRHVSIPALNDSKYIGMCVYNVVVMCIVGVALSFIIQNNPNAAFGILSLFILFCTTVTLCLVFVPKLVELRRDPRGEEKKIRCLSSKGSFRMTSTYDDSDVTLRMKCLKTDNIKLKKLLAEKEKEIDDLLDKLGMKPSYRYEPSQSNHLVVETSVTTLFGEEKQQTPQIIFENDCSVTNVENFDPWPNSGTRVNGNPRTNASSNCKEYYDLPNKKYRDHVLPTISSSNSCSEVDRESESFQEFGGIYIGIPVLKKSLTELHAPKEISKDAVDGNMTAADCDEDGLDVNSRLLEEEEAISFPIYSTILLDSLKETAILSDSDHGSCHDIIGSSESEALC
ncbi:gamma-aminobutyric acid type B receptor subunit 2-like isoform X2 [Ptychodera flava]|uniref:gamma-aminobutyric acid type B receptor subunit 2-like isoform X2 n=1 Tax=Ptychodera flava TaxID=63121 RepID=UPI00396AAC4F